MSWLKVNGIELSKVVSLPSPPTESRRDVGSTSEAADGSLVIVRQAVKHDLKVTARTLSGVAARAWEGLIAGDAHVWAFDSHFYSSKGLVGVGADGANVQTSAKKYGLGSLEFEASSTFTITFPFEPKTIAFWHSSGSEFASDFRHFVWEPAMGAAAWVDGILTASPSPAIADMLTLTGSVLQLKNIDDFAYFDDLVVCPYTWPADWPYQVATAGLPFGPAPFLNCTGDMIPEGARRMACKPGSISARLTVANLGNGMDRTARAIDAELVET